MSLFFGTTEITKLRDLAPQTGLDITDLWFGSTNVYTVWQTYEGTLPATINANGDDMKQYQVWGNTGGVGDRTENLFEIESDMLSSLNWDDNPRLDNKVYFINYKLSDAVTQELKKGIHTCSIFEHFTDGYTPNLLVCAFVPTLTSTITEEYRILTNQGVTFIRTFDFSQWQDIYLIIGYGNAFTTQAVKQLKINELFENWEISIVEGSTPPASFVPFGYKLDMSVSSGNLCYKEITGANIDGTVKIIDDLRYNTCIFECTQGETYTIKNEDTVIVYAFFDSEPRTGSSPYDNARVVVSGNTASFTAPITGWCATRYIATNTSAMAVRGSTVPEKYQPYSNTTTPIYIGSNPLDKDEYVDYQAGKIYRMIDGILTPTDPPVPLPALPTCEGTTIIDYVGQSVAPEKVLLKYRKEGF